MVRRFLSRVTWQTWLIWALCVATLLEPGYMRFNFGVATVDATHLISILKGENDGHQD